MGELKGALKFFLFVAAVGLVMILMDKGIHSVNLADTIGGTGEVLFFAGLGVLLIAKK